MKTIPPHIIEAINVLRKHDYQNRAILCNINNEYFSLGNEEVNEAFKLLNMYFITWDDEGFDTLVRYLYNMEDQN
ncbi:hypothetical protein PDJ86_22405 [Bacillus cereus group sp. TH36-2LC]|uniref:hypothetical protein n=1 Tax=Bacillus cereus group sp. TH36-2LC TaxID=3018040 RepID=UPI0022E14597|nr:hypothetical protein [Bacillus cereus group sp. TH36-2LC]MDA1509612.1 hypothetical protein [Bacillus cereus group sp. TH36-2LC]